MNNCDDYYPFGLYAVNETVAVDQSFPSAWIAEFRNDSSTVWQGAKAPCAFHNRLDDSASIKIRIARNILRNQFKVFERLGGPVDQESHFSSFFSTSF